MSSHVVLAFDDADPAEEMGGFAKIKQNNEETETPSATLTVRSKAKGGKTVEVTLTKNQANRVSLHKAQTEAVGEIARTVPSYRLALKQTTSALFSTPFCVVLRKRDCFR